jgi:hypothetical protein
MKKIILATLLVTNANAFLNDFINSIHSPTLRNVIRNSANIQVGSNHGVQVSEEVAKSECAQRIIKARASQVEKGEMPSFGYLTHSIWERHLEGDYTQDFESDEYFGKEAKRGLKNNIHINFNSYNSHSAPHAEADCSKYISIDKVEIVELDGKKCRRVSFVLDDDGYKSYFCLGEHNAYADYLDTEAEVLEVISPKTEDCH